jgi:hypothetical protein
VFGLIQRNGFGVAVQDPAFAGEFKSDRSSDIVVASWRDSLGRLQPFVCVYTSGFARDESKGAYDEHTALRSAELRVELPVDLTARLRGSAHVQTSRHDAIRPVAEGDGLCGAETPHEKPGTIHKHYAECNLKCDEQSAKRETFALSHERRVARETQQIIGLLSTPQNRRRQPEDCAGSYRNKECEGHDAHVQTRRSAEPAALLTVASAQSRALRINRRDYPVITQIRTASAEDRGGFS